jgi:hypothetical protein
VNTEYFTVDFKDERRPRAWECRKPLGSRKSKETDSPLEPPGNAALLPSSFLA